MILIKCLSQYGKAERLAQDLSSPIMEWVERMEIAGFTVAFYNLPSHIDTPEVYAAILLDQLSDMYQPETSQLN